MNERQHKQQTRETDPGDIWIVKLPGPTDTNHVFMLMETKRGLKHFIKKWETIKCDVSNIQKNKLETLELKDIIIKLEVSFY